jgi:AhpD family alkylhydroperoxidase
MRKSTPGAGLPRSPESARVLRKAGVLLRQIERGARFNHRLLRRFISAASGMRLPAAARVAGRNKALLGLSLGAWSQAAMRGPSAWSVAERELMAAMVAKWSACAFCTDLHAALAAKYLDQASVDAVLAEYRAAPISEGLKVTLAFLETMTLRPRELTEAYANEVLGSGISIETLANAIEICVVSKLVSRYANALDFTAPSATAVAGRPTRWSRGGVGAL